MNGDMAMTMIAFVVAAYAARVVFEAVATEIGERRRQREGRRPELPR